MDSPDPASSVPSVRIAVASYLEEKQEALSPDKLQVLGAGLHTLLEPVLDELVTALSNLRLVLLAGELKNKVSPKTGRRLADSTFRRYVLIGQSFAAWSSSRWPRQVAERPSAPAAEGGPDSKQRLGELIRLLRTDAGIMRDQLGEMTKLGTVVIKRVETGRQRLTQRQLDLLLTAPAMSGLMQWAEREGIPVEVAEDGGTGTEGGGTGYGTGGTAAPRVRGAKVGDGEGGGSSGGVGGGP